MCSETRAFFLFCCWCIVFKDALYGDRMQLWAHTNLFSHSCQESDILWFHCILHEAPDELTITTVRVSKAGSIRLGHWNQE